MRIRTMLTLLALLALFSITIGGVYYYYSLQNSAYALAYRRVAQRTEMIRTQVSGFLSENLKPVKTLAIVPEIRQAVLDPAPDKLDAANRILDHFKNALDVDVCYVMDRRGLTIASSNRHDPDSFVGSDFSFRPYFQDAYDGRTGKYMALGSTSNKRGAYYSYPVLDPDGYVVGVVVIKASIELMESSIIRTNDGITLLVGPHGMIFSANRTDWLFKTMRQLKPDEEAGLAASRQFGPGPWKWLELTDLGDNTVADKDGGRYVMNALDVDDYQGWQVIHLVNIRDISESVFRPLVRTTSWLVFSLCLVAGFSVFYLYRKARREIVRRRGVENELRDSEERYRTLYHNTPAMLLSLDPEGRILHVSDYWSQGFGYSFDEVVGKLFYDFLDEESRRQAETVVLPGLFELGHCRDASFRFRNSQGRMIDVLMTGISERESGDEAPRALAVLIDITERKQAEEELRQAQEKLSFYSKDLELQVRARTREVAGFFEYTPAVIYLKDMEGRYLLVNSRHEELFNTKNEETKGKTVYDVFPREMADQFSKNDLQVLTSKQPFQAEESVTIAGEKRVFLSVRFPILDEAGEVNRLCGISVDVSELKEAQEKLRKLSGSIITSQEKERMALARELHDELGQILTALRMDAVWIRERLMSLDPQAAERAATMCNLIDSTITEVGSLARRLRPAVLDDLGLVDGLEWHTTDFESRTGIVCVFKALNIPQVGEVLSVAVYRVAQEALTNVARHSEATHVDVTLTAAGEQLCLEVRDNGHGFDLKAVSDEDRLGLAGMRERAYLVGGQLEIRSNPGEGTMISLQVPLHRYGG